MADPTSERQAALTALNAVRDPKTGQGLVDAGLVQGLMLRAGRAGFMLEVTAADAAAYEPVVAQAEAALRSLPGVERAQVVLTATRATDDEPALAPGAVRVRRNATLSPQMQADTQPRKPPPTAKPLPYVRHVVAVASGKGGVGKSTVAVNLACALAGLGLKVGLLDADVYGPSVPRMTGLTDDPQIGPDKKLIPLEGWGLKVMSIGLIVDEAAPMIWRGPMASSAFSQMALEVAWGSEAQPLDVLVVDMPPGTGDIQLSLIQKVTLSGAVVVSTPQEVALIDARRAVAMFSKTEVPILGVVENMAYFPDPATGAAIEIFGRGGARQLAGQLGASFLGEVPIDIAVRQGGDDGRPVAAALPDSVAGQAFRAMATQVAGKLSGLTPRAN